MKRYTQEEIRQSVQTIADTYLSMYETMRDQKTVTIADDAAIQKLRKTGFPQQGRPLDILHTIQLMDKYARALKAERFPDFS